MAPVNPHEGETLVRVHFSVPGENIRTYEYLNCYGFYSGDRFFVRSYDDDPGMPARASFLSEYVLIVEHQGKHEARQPQKPSKRSVEPPVAPPTALPDDEASEAAMERFLAAAPKAESHLPERRFLESAEGEADPKEEWSIAGTSLSGQKAVAIPSGSSRIPSLPENIPGTPLSATNYLPLETQPEEVERRIKELRPKVELAKEVTHGVAIPSTAGPEMNFSGPVENRETRRKKRTAGKPLSRGTGSHAKPKPPTGQALSALVLPLVGFFLAAFRVRMG